MPDAASPKILVLANLPPHVVGGAENQSARLVERWLSRGAAVEVAGTQLPDGQVAVGGSHVRTHSLRPIGAGRPGRAAGYAWRLARLLLARRDAFDVVYSRSVGDGVLVVAALRQLGLVRMPLVACPINAAGKGDVHYIGALPLSRALFRLVDRNVAAINLINEDVAGELDAVGVTRPVRTRIPNGVAIRPAVRRGQVGSPRRLVWTGRFERQKRIDLLLHALASCRARGDRFTARLVGGGTQLQPLRSLCGELGLDDVVRFDPEVPPPQVRALLEQADAFVLPSAYEGMSNSAIEAMEAGLPVLATRCGGIDRYLAEGAGWVCDVESQASMESALAALLATGDAALLAMGAAARAVVERHFDIEAVADRNLALLRSVVDARQRPGLA